MHLGFGFASFTISSSLALQKRTPHSGKHSVRCMSFNNLFLFNRYKLISEKMVEVNKKKKKKKNNNNKNKNKNKNINNTNCHVIQKNMSEYSHKIFPPKVPKLHQRSWCPPVPCKTSGNGSYPWCGCDSVVEIDSSCAFYKKNFQDSRNPRKPYV